MTGLICAMVSMINLRKQVKNALNNCKNFQIQSLSASIVNRAAIKLNRYMKENNINGYVCAQIHDQLIIRVKQEDVETMKSVMQETMEGNYTLSVALKAKPEVATNWYEGH